MILTAQELPNPNPKKVETNTASSIQNKMLNSSISLLTSTVAGG